MEYICKTCNIKFTNLRWLDTGKAAEPLPVTKCWQCHGPVVAEEVKNG